MISQLNRALLSLAIGALIYCIADESIFGSDWYLRFLEPDSLAGGLELLLHEESHTQVAVVGNSMLAEGFSAKLADAEASGRYRFSNLSLPATSLRCWFYLLRAIDPNANRYAALVIQTTSYTDEDLARPMADHIEDVHIVDALLTPSDIPEFAMSYHNPRLKFEAARGALLKGYIYKNDFQAFLESPSQRLAKVALARRDHASWLYDYDGRQPSLSGLTVDWNNRSMHIPPSVPQSTQANLREQAFPPPVPVTGAQTQYVRQWLGRILHRYENSKTKIIIIRVPRGPVINPAANNPSTSAVRDLAASHPNVQLVDPHAFQALETPEYFSDELHMNSVGRKLFSRLLVRQVESCCLTQ